MAASHVLRLSYLLSALLAVTAITPNGRRQTPGLVPLDPEGIYGSLEVRLFLVLLNIPSQPNGCDPKHV
jgi:hypothetical protein